MGQAGKMIRISILLIIFLGCFVWINTFGSGQGTWRERSGEQASYAVAAEVESTAQQAVTTPTVEPPISACVDHTGMILTIRGNQPTQYNTRYTPLPANSTVIARTATWNHVDDYPVVITGGPDICFSGGTVIGEYPFSTDWDTMHNTTGFTFRTTGKTTVENIRVHNYGDGISFSRGDPSYSFHIVGVHMTYIRDDCVQNDLMYSGLIEDSLFDGCYTAFSAQSHGAKSDLNGGQNVWTIQNSLIRLQPMEKVYNNQGIVPGHGAFFKWDSDDQKSPRLALHNNVFRVDQLSNSNHGLGLPEGKLESCSNNLVVWLGNGDYPDPLPETFDGQPCFQITTDKTVWENAVQDWSARHEFSQ